MGAKGNKINPQLSIIISFEANGTTMMDLGIIFHVLPLGSTDVRPIIDVRPITDVRPINNILSHPKDDRLCTTSTLWRDRTVLIWVGRVLVSGGFVRGGRGDEGAHRWKEGARRWEGAHRGGRTSVEGGRTDVRPYGWVAWEDGAFLCAVYG